MVYERYIQHGASERMVVSPGPEADAILHLSADDPDTRGRTIASSTRMGWKGGRCPWWVSAIPLSLELY